MTSTLERTGARNAPEKRLSPMALRIQASFGLLMGNRSPVQASHRADLQKRWATCQMVGESLLQRLDSINGEDGDEASAIQAFEQEVEAIADEAQHFENGDGVTLRERIGAMGSAFVSGFKELLGGKNRNV